MKAFIVTFAGVAASVLLVLMFLKVVVYIVNTNESNEQHREEFRKANESIPSLSSVEDCEHIPPQGYTMFIERRNDAGVIEGWCCQPNSIYNCVR